MARNFQICDILWKLRLYPFTVIKQALIVLRLQNVGPVSIYYAAVRLEQRNRRKPIPNRNPDL